MEHYIDEEVGRWKYIDYDNIISVLDNGKKKLFRIYNVVKSIYKVVCYARPVFYDLINTVLLETNINSKNGQEALTEILKGTQFKAHSDISVTNTVSYIRKNIVEALLGDDENSFINIYKGEFYCENFDIYINSTIGSDNNVSVRFGYNLAEIEQEIDTSGVVTRIIPVGSNGIMLGGSEPWVDSSNLNKYPHPRAKVIQFDDVKVKENKDDTEGFDTLKLAQDELKKRCEQMFAEGVDQPLVNFKIDMVNLANVISYKDFQSLVNVSGGDTIYVYVPNLDINLKTRVIDFERDMLTGEYISIELGNALDNYIQDQVNMQHNVNKVSGTINSDGTLKADLLSGVVDAHKTIFKATKDVAQPQEVLAMMFEDRVEKSPTFGCVAIGSQGLMMASEYVPGTTDWDFRTFGTGKGLVADEITSGTLNANLLKTGTIKSADGKVNINLNNGAFTLTNAAGTVIIDGEHNIHKIMKEGTAAINYTTGNQASITVAHNLGYKPAFSAFQQQDNEYTMLPAPTWNDNNGAYAWIRARADEKNLYFDFLKLNREPMEPKTIQIKYFLYKEVAF